MAEYDKRFGLKSIMLYQAKAPGVMDAISSYGGGNRWKTNAFHKNTHIHTHIHTSLQPPATCTINVLSPIFFSNAPLIRAVELYYFFSPLK